MMLYRLGILWFPRTMVFSDGELFYLLNDVWYFWLEWMRLECGSRLRITLNKCNYWECMKTLENHSH